MAAAKARVGGQIVPCGAPCFTCLTHASATSSATSRAVVTSRRISDVLASLEALSQSRSSSIVGFMFPHLYPVQAVRNNAPNTFLGIRTSCITLSRTTGIASPVERSPACRKPRTEDRMRRPLRPFLARCRSRESLVALRWALAC